MNKLTTFFQDNELLSKDDILSFRAFVRPKDEPDYNKIVENSWVVNRSRKTTF